VSGRRTFFIFVVCLDYVVGENAHVVEAGCVLSCARSVGCYEFVRVVWTGTKVVDFLFMCKDAFLYDFVVEFIKVK